MATMPTCRSNKFHHVKRMIPSSKVCSHGDCLKRTQIKAHDSTFKEVSAHHGHVE